MENILHEELEKNPQELSDAEVDEFIESALATADKISAGDPELNQIMGSLGVDQRAAAMDLSKMYSELMKNDKGSFRKYTRRTLNGEDEFLAAWEIYGEKIATNLKGRSKALFG